jgi:hypothetical protein
MDDGAPKEGDARERIEVAVGEEAARVLGRLDRIRALDHNGAPAGALLDELRELVAEAEAWARLEGDERARSAVAGLESSLRRGAPLAWPHAS